MKTAKLVLGLGFFALSGCGVLQTRESLKEQDQKREISDRVGNLQKSNADTQNRFNEIEASVRELSGKIEVLENHNSQEAKTTEKAKKQNEENITSIDKKVDLLKEDITKLQEQISNLSAEISAIKSEKESREKEPTVANSKSDGGPFGQAETFFAKKEWKKAILSYQKFRETKPKDKKIPEAIYKIGVCFQELSMIEEAKTFYDELVAKFPNSPEAKKAKSRAKKLK